jgi:acyl-CoA dehydrogenase
LNSLFVFSKKAQALSAELTEFMIAEVYPLEPTVEAWNADAEKRWQPCPVIEALKVKAKQQGLWNLFLPDATHGAALSNLDYAPLAEQMGRVLWASEIFNCNAPDTGNMELLAHFATEAQKDRWLNPLLNGNIRSAFAMTEPNVASSDATNIALVVRKEKDGYVLNGRKWWITGAGDSRCQMVIVMGLTNPHADAHSQHSMILVPMNSAGAKRAS